MSLYLPLAGTPYGAYLIQKFKKYGCVVTFYAFPTPFSSFHWKVLYNDNFPCSTLISQSEEMSLFFVIFKI